MRSKGQEQPAKRKRSRKLAEPTRHILEQPVSQLPAGYKRFLVDLKTRIRAAQIKAAISVNRELIQLYWDIGRGIAERQAKEKWGTAVIERLATDLQKAFPDMKGFSARNIWFARSFYLAYTQQVKKVKQAVSELDGVNLPQLAAEIPWGHNIILLQKINDPNERIWYASKTIEHGWSRNVLVHQIESNLYHRQGKAITSFARNLPTPQSDLAQQTLKDPYVFDFLTLDKDAREREFEKGLLQHIREFLLELGVGFAFVGSQYHIEVDQTDFYLDLLFYHLKLRCYIVIDLKMREFQPEYAGKMNFYLSAVDDSLRHPDDEPSIGLILCKSKKRLIVEYALRDTSKPIGVSAYKLTKSLPKKLKGSLPTIKELETELE